MLFGSDHPSRMLHRGARKFALTHGLLLTSILIATVYTAGAFCWLAVVELVAWIPFVLAAPRGCIARLTLFLAAVTLTSGLFSLCPPSDRGSAGMMFRDPRALLLTFGFAITVLLVLRQFVYVFKDASHVERWKSRSWLRFSISDIAVWTTLAAILSVASRRTDHEISWILLLAFSAGHAIIIVMAISFSVWFWLSPGNISNRIDWLIVLVVAVVPLMILVNFYIGNRGTSGAASIPLYFVFVGLIYSVYLVGMFAFTRRNGIFVARKSQIRLDPHRLPKKLEAFEL